MKKSPAFVWAAKKEHLPSALWTAASVNDVVAKEAEKNKKS